MAAIIKVENLGKKYQLKHQTGDYLALRDRLTDIYKLPLKILNRQKYSKEKEDFWALKNINFEIQAGEAVGIIGRNGAGKSTLLKILSRITPPTTGKITLHGRIASLLEVGTGFHPELTGRENIFLNGAILGMRRNEINKKFDEIVSFAEIDQFLDTPVKRYSSGMYVRLAFAVAAHLEPEILLVDEVLAVGDVQFQKKCLGKMKNVAEGGRTVLFVTHNMQAIQMLCQKAIFLDKGTLVSMDKVDKQVEAYLKSTNKKNVIDTNNTIKITPNIILKKFIFSPKIIKTRDSLSFELCLSAEKSVTINAIAIIFSSSLNVKTSILDLRQHENYHLNNNESLNIQGKINSFPLVEGDYTASLYIKYDGGIERHCVDIVDINVVAETANNNVIPFPPAARGFLELDYNFSVKKI